MGKEHNKGTENMSAKGRRMSCPMPTGLPPRPDHAPEEPISRSRPRRKSSPAVILAPALSRLSPEFARRTHADRCNICSEKISFASNLSSSSNPHTNVCGNQPPWRANRPRRGSTPNIHIGGRRPSSPYPYKTRKGPGLSRQISTSLDYLNGSDAKAILGSSEQVSAVAAGSQVSNKPTYGQLWASTGVHPLPRDLVQRLKTKPPMKPEYGDDARRIKTTSTLPHIKNHDQCSVVRPGGITDMCKKLNSYNRRRGSYDFGDRKNRVTFDDSTVVCPSESKIRMSRRRSRGEIAPRPRSVPANPHRLSCKLSPEAQSAVLGFYADEIVREFTKTHEGISESLEAIEVDDDLVTDMPQVAKIDKIEEGMGILDSVRKQGREVSYQDLLQNTLKEFERWRAGFCTNVNNQS